jgi:hypothetical protein
MASKASIHRGPADHTGQYAPARGARSQSAAFQGMKGMKRPDTPFPKHWFYYIVLKYAIIAAAILIALYVALQLS